MSNKWVIKIKGNGYASKEYFRNCMSGRPIVKNRAKALELTTAECELTRGVLMDVFREMRSKGIKLKDVDVCAADGREDFLGLAGWWDIFATFAKY